MKKAVIISVLYAVMFVVGLTTFTSCSNDEEEPEITSIVGKWKSSFKSSDGYQVDLEYTFNSDGTYLGYSWVRGHSSVSTTARSSGNYVHRSRILTLYEKECSFHSYDAKGVDFGQMDRIIDSDLFSLNYSTEFKDSKLYIDLFNVPLILEGHAIEFITPRKTEFTYQRQ